MTTKFGSRLLAGLVAVLGYHPPAAAQQPADLLLLNGRVYTADESLPRAEAVGVRGDRIVFVGSTAEANKLRGTTTRIIDLAGRTVIPGMTDSHGHFTSLGTAMRTVDLVGTTDYSQVVERVAQRAADQPPGAWVVGRGWDQNDWPVKEFPTHEALSRATPQNPVVLSRVDGHAILANAKAMEIAGVTRNTPDPQGGRILRDANGNPTGVFIDNAMALVWRVMPEQTEEQKREGLRLAQAELNRLGITGVHDAGVNCPEIRLFETMAKAGELTVRNYIMIDGDFDDCLDEMFKLGPRSNADGNHMVAVRAIKLSADGALGSRGARLLEPYSDEPDQRGLELIPPQRIRQVADGALRHGFQLNVHAIGDGANRTVLDVFEQALRARPTRDHRFRIEHAQILSPADIPRFKQLGVIPSMQTVHQTSDMYWAEDRVGPQRIKGAYAWRSLLDSGVIIAGGSDFPVESPDPMHSFKAAVTRQDAKGWPPGGWYPEQRMTREEALKHLTIWPAYASFREDLLGSITVGKLADIVVLSQDIMTVPEDRILDTRVEMTIVGGKIVYEASARAQATDVDAAGVYEFSTYVSGQPVTGTIHIEGTPGAYTGRILTGMFGEIPLAEIKVEGNELTARATMPEGELFFRLTFEGKEFSGNWSLGDMGAEITGKKRATSHTFDIHPLDSPATASLRGLSVVSEQVVWASGARGTVLRSTDGGATWQLRPVPNADSLDFRDIEAFDSLHAYVLSAGEDGRIYYTNNGGASWTQQFRNQVKGAFFDCFAFFDRTHGIAMSDPVNGRYLLVATENGKNWKPLNTGPSAREGEAAFAASGTCLTAAGSRLLLASGAGPTARVFWSDDRGRTWHTSETPVPAAQPGAGIFALAFRDAQNGIAIGGNYEQPDQTATVAVTQDGGKTWTAAGTTSYTSGAAWSRSGASLLAVGTPGTRLSTDAGQTWSSIGSEEYNAVQFASENVAYAVGPRGKIAKLVRR